MRAACTVLAAFCSFVTVALLSPLAIAQQLPSGERLQSVSRPNLAIGGVLHGYDNDWNTENYVEYLVTAEREFSAVTSTAYMAYGAWPDPTQTPDTSRFEEVVDWATAAGKKVHGHVLLWPAANEKLDWWKRVRRNETESTLRHYVESMVTCRAGEVWVWDVVNEVMADDGEAMDASGLRTSYKEYKNIGPNYVDLAFQWARQAEQVTGSEQPALLILNDYNIETLCPKSDRLLAYAIALRERGVPIDGIGFQMHFIDSVFEPNYASIEANLQRFADAGFQLFITELDVAATATDDPLQLPTAEQLAQQARVFQRIANIAYRQPACAALLMWDFADERSWLHPSTIDTEYLALGQYSFPTPFWGGRNQPMVAKPAYYGLQAGLAGNEPEVPSTRIYRITNALEPSTGVLVRDSVDGVAADTVSLASSTDISIEDSAVWHFEPVGGSVYRIRCQFGDANAYLSRASDPVGLNWIPNEHVCFDQLDETWYSQMWLIAPSGSGVTIHSAWEPDSGYLTRNTHVTPARGKKPAVVTILDSVSLAGASDMPGQVWLLEEVNSTRSEE